eukprot:jgi/Undpi1/9503/HiC_scaffold_27.g11959.m1
MMAHVMRISVPREKIEAMKRLLFEQWPQSSREATARDVLSMAGKLWNLTYVVRAASEELEETKAVRNCTGTSWRYLLADGTYTTNLSFPDAKSKDETTKVAFPGLFNASADDLVVDSIPTGKAVAASDSLYGRTVEVTLSCEVEDDEDLDDEDACVMFEVNFTNTSPIPDVTIALYRFDDPAIPGVVLPPSGNSSPGDIQLNHNNSIVQLDGSDVQVGCNGDVADYLGEDGEWYFWFTGSNGELYNLTHVFYATEQDHLNIATIQRLHLSVRDGCISEERFSATRSTAVKNMLNNSGASTHPCLRPCELIRALSIIQPHACLHTVVELADDGEHYRWHAKTSKDIPQKGSVDGAICFDGVDKSQVQGGVLPRQYLQSSYYEHHVNRRALGSEPTLFLRQNVLAFAIVTQATHDHFEEYIAGVSHDNCHTQSDLLVKHLNRCILALLRYATSPPHGDDDIVELSESVQFSFLGQKLQELGRETIGPYRLLVCQRTDRLLYFVPRRDIVQWSARGPLHKLVHNARVKDRRLGVEQYVKPPHPPLADEGIIPQQSTSLVFDVLRVKRPLPFHIHPLEVFAEAKLMSFSDTPLELANVSLRVGLRNI